MLAMQYSRLRTAGAGVTKDGRQVFTYTYSSAYAAAQAVFEEAQVRNPDCGCLKDTADIAIRIGVLFEADGRLSVS